MRKSAWLLLVALCGCGESKSYETYAEAAAEARMPAFVPTSATEIRLAEEDGAQWLAFRVPTADARTLTAGLGTITWNEARQGRIQAPAAIPDWPDELDPTPPAAARPHLRFYRASTGVACLAVDWLEGRVFAWPCT